MIRMERIRNMSPAELIRLAIVITVIVAISTIVIITIIWRIGNGTTLIVWDLWSMLEGISSALAFAAVVGGGVVILFQLVEAIDNRHIDVFNRVFEKWMDDEHIEARRFIYQDLPADPEIGLSTIDAEGRAKVKRILNSIDYLGFLIDQGWVDDEGIIEWVSPIVVKVWVKLGPYIDYEIEERGKESDYYAAVRSLAQRCTEWRAINKPQDEVKLLGKGTL